MSKTLIITEKPSVARDIARVVQAHQAFTGYFEGTEYWVTWALGHLVTLPEPHEINAGWKKWKKESLPMLPDAWPLKLIEKTEFQFRIIQNLLKQCKKIICATDAGREGELIFRYIYEAAECKKSVKRLWISTLTPDAIEEGLKNLSDQKKYDSLAEAARARSCADWLVGMNLSRAYTLHSGSPYFVGRVQTPTLAILVKRELEIKEFKAEKYFEIKATFQTLAQELQSEYSGFYVGKTSDFFPPTPGQAKRLPNDPEATEEICKLLKQGEAQVLRVDSKVLKEMPPLFYDLTDLQRHANRLFGYTAALTLSTAQSLYEKHKLISYPRTDSRHLSHSVAKTLTSVVQKIASGYENLNPSTGLTPLGARYVDDQEVTDHHAIIPTLSTPSSVLSQEEKSIYDLICRRILSAWQGDHITSVKTVFTQVNFSNDQRLFKSQGTAIQEIGWKILDIGFQRDSKKEAHLPAAIEPKQRVNLIRVQKDLKSTHPPAQLNDSSLLKAMETAGRDLDDQDLAQVMGDAGLGTAATRAGMIETLLARGYVKRDGRALIPTDQGIDLIQTVHSSVKSADLTARWEKELQQIQNGKQTFSVFLQNLKKEIKERVSEVFSSPMIKKFDQSEKLSSYSEPRTSIKPFESFPDPILPSAPQSTCPPQNLATLLKQVFGFSFFRPHQEEVCLEVSKGRDMLLVMPTGAGKSLCYQLPGIARRGTTIVIAPLLALIEDQVEKLKHKGIRAERIHSGRKREESRQVCGLYLSGELDFLFIAPERLSVPGFPEMLKKRTPALIAIDEAHCISQWGHDFRPDYRQLGERLKHLRPAPIIALTATATPLVQNDIITQLGMGDAHRSIHGFRRDNIAIRISETPVNKRLAEIKKVLKKKNALPAIIYAPTRKMTDHYYSELKDIYRVGYYHAGLSNSERERHQERFIRGELDVMVATIAFGMGIDKPNIRTIIHAAIPGSVEGYYQEIGRAGRDGLPAQAILLQSYVDQRTHDFFFKRDYPDLKTLKDLFHQLSDKKLSRNEIRSKVPALDFETLDKAIEKLVIHGGAHVDFDQMIYVGKEGWQKTYVLQREHKEEQMRKVADFIEAKRCRMLSLVRHFGDQNDLGAPCTLCDRCQATPKKTKMRIKRNKSKTSYSQVLHN